MTKLKTELRYNTFITTNNSFIMSANLIKNIPADCKLFCLLNYDVHNFISATGEELPDEFNSLLKEPIIVRSLAEAKQRLANKFNLPLENLTEWEVIGDLDENFAPSIYIVLKNILCGEEYIDASYAFDVYTTVNTLELL